MLPSLINLLYLLAAVLFIVGLKMMSRVPTARRGNTLSAVGMLIATLATFLFISDASLLVSLLWIGAAMLVGAGVGLWMATKTPMTSMPQMVALLNGFGGAASLLVACGDYFRHLPSPHPLLTPLLAPLTSAPLRVTDALTPALNLALAQGTHHLAHPAPAVAWYALLATGLATLIGGVTFTGSLMAYGKLQGVRWAPDRPVQFPGQQVAVAAGLLLCVTLSALLIAFPTQWWLLALVALLSLTLGVLLVIGIGGADMPVVVALLNSYSGLAAAMAGFVLSPPNIVLIITGSLVGASGLILTSIMCRAMNRSLMNVLFGGMGSGPVSTGKEVTGTAHPVTPETAALALEAASRVVIVPGYGLAVAQAQHAVKELQRLLEERGVDVSYAIHPVAGRMPGHMNVLLAEAGVDYDRLLDLDSGNAALGLADVALVIGANDVTNPAARTDDTSPLYGMPILDVDRARRVFVVKRSLNPGFAGIQNGLYFLDHTGMIFGDAKKIVGDLTQELEAF